MLISSQAGTEPLLENSSLNTNRTPNSCLASFKLVLNLFSQYLMNWNLKGMDNLDNENSQVSLLKVSFLILRPKTRTLAETSSDIFEAVRTKSIIRELKDIIPRKLRNSFVLKNELKMELKINSLGTVLN